MVWGKFRDSLAESLGRTLGMSLGGAIFAGLSLLGIALARIAGEWWRSPQLPTQLSNTTAQILLGSSAAFAMSTALLTIALRRRNGSNQQPETRAQKFLASYAPSQHIVWRVWIDPNKGPGYMEIQSFCGQCDWPLRATLERGAVCPNNQCDNYHTIGQLASFEEYDQEKDTVKVIAQGDWRMDRRNFLAVRA